MLPHSPVNVNSSPIKSILQGTLRFSPGRMELSGLIESRGETGGNTNKALGMKSEDKLRNGAAVLI